MPTRSLPVMSCARSQPPNLSLQLRTRKLIALPVLFLSFCALVACGGAAATVETSGRLDADGLTGPERYAQAVRLASLARVEARAGLQQLAAEHWRAATRLGGEPIWVVEQAEAQERARLYAEAGETATRALARDLNPAEKQRVEQLLARVTPQIPPGLVRVAILVRPEGARVELSRADRKNRRGAERVLIGTGHAWLAVGTWAVETTAKGFSSELRTVQVGAEGNLVAIALVPEDQGQAMVNAQSETHESPLVPPVPVAVEKPIVVAPTPAPAEVVEAAPPPQKPQEIQKPVEVAKPLEQPQPAEVLKPAETPKPDEQPKPVEVVTPVEPTKPAEDAKQEVRAPTGVEKSAEPVGSVSWIHKVGPYAVAGLGVLALGAGGWFGAQALSAANSANALNPKGASYSSQIDTLGSSAQSNATLSNVLIVSGGALVVAGAAWWLLAPHADVPKSRTHAQVEASPVAAAVPLIGVSPSSFSLTWSF